MRRIVQAVSLVMCRAVAVGAAGAPRLLLLAALATGAGVVRLVHAQQAEAPHFDVVSIKRSMTPESGGRNALEAGRYIGTGVTLRRIIGLAYMPLPVSRLVGGPRWLATDRFDVEAKFTGAPPREQVQAMMRAMLADRFRLRTHVEMRPALIYALRVLREGTLGPSLTTSSADCRAERCNFQYLDGLIRGRGVTLDRIAGEITAGRTVVNRTGLTDVYDVELRWTPDSIQPSADDAAPGLVTALREQLGLKLESDTMTLDFLVIDAAERPEEN
jgi:uncharacterized protein (TIGR03435 family)